ncbi:MAG: LysR family transcriptional regulator, partial [Lachnospiraceae bacterium]|nr:LysR family transcriptional regulator [Lachnospiraceae bacterium]
LFALGTKKLEPTDLGRSLYPEACTLVAQFQSLELNLHTRSQQRKTELSIALGQGVFSVIPSEILLDFQQLHPEILLHFSNASDMDIVADVRAGRLDFGIIGAYKDLLIDLDAIRIQSSPRMHLHVSLDNPLSQREELEMADLRGQAFISSAPQSHSYLFTVKECQALGFVPDFRFYNLDVHATQAITCRCKGITWSFPPGRPEHAHPKLKTIPLKFSDPSWGTYIISQPGQKLSAAAHMLIHYLQEHVQDV